MSAGALDGSGSGSGSDDSGEHASSFDVSSARPSCAPSTLRPPLQSQAKITQQSSPLHPHQQQQRVSSLMPQASNHPPTTQSNAPTAVQLFHARPSVTPSASRSFGNFYVSESGFGESSDEDEGAPSSAPVRVASVPGMASSFPSSSSAAAAPSFRTAASSHKMSGTGSGTAAAGAMAARAPAPSAVHSAVAHDSTSSNHLRSLMSELLSSLRKTRANLFALRDVKFDCVFAATCTMAEYDIVICVSQVVTLPTACFPKCTPLSSSAHFGHSQPF